MDNIAFTLIVSITHQNIMRLIVSLLIGMVLALGPTLASQAV